MRSNSLSLFLRVLLSTNFYKLYWLSILETQMKTHLVFFCFSVFWIGFDFWFGFWLPKFSQGFNFRNFYWFSFLQHLTFFFLFSFFLSIKIYYFWFQKYFLLFDTKNLTNFRLPKLTGFWYTNFWELLIPKLIMVFDIRKGYFPATDIFSHSRYLSEIFSDLRFSVICDFFLFSLASITEI